MVKYALRENTLGENSKGCIAVVSALGVASFRQVFLLLLVEFEKG